MDVSRARTKDPGEWLETCPDFSQPLAEQLTEWILNGEPDLTEVHQVESALFLRAQACLRYQRVQEAFEHRVLSRLGIA